MNSEHERDEPDCWSSSETSGPQLCPAHRRLLLSKGAKPMAIPTQERQHDKPFPRSDDPEGAFIQDLRSLMLEAAEAADRENDKSELTH